MTVEEKRMYDLLEKAVDDKSVRRVADCLHYLVVHAGIKQYYYELKFVRSGSRLLELIGKALRDLEVLKREKEHETKIKRFYQPSKDDLAVALKYYDSLGSDFIKILSGLTVASCPLCWEGK